MSVQMGGQVGGIGNVVNAITLHKLSVSSCNFTLVFSTSKSWTSLILTFE